jgi:hypothetical protein
VTTAASAGAGLGHLEFQPTGFTFVEIPFFHVCTIRHVPKPPSLYSFSCPKAGMAFNIAHLIQESHNVNPLEKILVPLPAAVFLLDLMVLLGNIIMLYNNSCRGAQEVN